MSKYSPASKLFDLQIAYRTDALTVKYYDRYYILKFNLRNFAIAALLLTGIIYWLSRPESEVDYTDSAQVIEEYLNDSHSTKSPLRATVRTTFLKTKARLIYDYTTRNNISRLDQLDDKNMLAFAADLTHLFQTKIIEPYIKPAHVRTFFTNTTDLDKIKTALIEQMKYHIPASITLAQAILETGYGRRIIHNNYFGLKAKQGTTKASYTIEYYTPKEYQFNKSKVVSAERIRKKGQVLYKCKIKDSFRHYENPWESFRDHSLFLSGEKRYAPLFVKGKDYKAWAKAIGSARFGGVGYATSPIYGETLKAIIERYGLDLLDY